MKSKKYRNIMYYQDFKNYHEEGLINSCNFQCIVTRRAISSDILQSYKSSISAPYDYNSNNSYLMFETGYREGITVMCGGEIFGTVGYVDKEHIDEVMDIIKNCKEYRIDLVDDKIIDNNIIKMVIYYIAK